MCNDHPFIREMYKASKGHYPNEQPPTAAPQSTPKDAPRRSTPLPPPAGGNASDGGPLVTPGVLAPDASLTSGFKALLGQ